MNEDFTTNIEQTIQELDGCFDFYRVDASPDGDNGSLRVTMEDGKIYFITYERAIS